MGGLGPQGGGGPHPVRRIKIEDQPIDVKVKDQPIDVKIEDQPINIKVKDQPIDIKIKGQPIDIKVKDQPIDIKIKGQPIDIKVRDQPIDVKIEDQPIDVNILNTINADITDRCSRLLGRLCFGGVAIDPRDRNWTLDFATDQVDITGSSVSISGTPDVNVTDRAARLLGITYGSQSQQLQQLAGTFDLITRPFGSQSQQLQQLAGTFDLITRPFGSQSQQLQQLAGTFDLITRPFGSQSQQLQQDATTGVNNLRVIETVHNRIHAGRVFEVTDVALGINTATPKRYLLVTPNTSTRIHMIILIVSEPGITIELFEDTTVTANGTGLSEINHNRTSANVAELTVFEDPTVTTDGTVLFAFRSGTSTGGARVGGRVQREDEYVLKQNANYQIKITPISNNTDITTDISWYEVV